MPPSTDADYLPANSPRKPGAGGAQNFVTSASPWADTKSARGAIRDELLGKQEFNKETVFQRLGLSLLSNTLVESCQRAMLVDEGTKGAMLELQSLVGKAEGHREDELDGESEEEIRPGEKPPKDTKRREKRMYPHLVKFSSLS